MAISQYRSRRKSSGGRYRRSFKKKLRELGSLPTLTSIGAKKTRVERGLGSNVRVGLRIADVANVYDPSTKTYSQAKIVSVVENPANSNYTRRNILTKGAVIKTEKGDAKIVSRPGQSSTVNAVLIKK